MKLKHILFSAALLASFTACDDLFEPAQENNRGVEEMLNDPNYATGLLGYGYAMLPYDTKSVSDVATDDAVTNDLTSAYSKMALGSWTSSNNPMQKWQACKATIQYLNTFLGIVDQVSWAKNEVTQKMFVYKLRGEALALRALNYYYLLMNHGGYDSNGNLLGVPLLLVPEDNSSDFNQPRASFADCIKQIMADLDEAISLLPVEYKNYNRDNEIPQKYQDMGAKVGNFNLVFGTYQLGRIDARIAEAIKAQAALLAASPAYRDGSEVTSETAANLAAAVLDRIGGVSGLDPKGHIWFNNTTMLDALGSGSNPAEVLWRGNKTNGDADWDMGINQESDNFPPTLYGKGRINPTQNLVDAFPMANGYPIGATGSAYDAANPYANRDPRLSQYVIYDGVKFKGKVITTGLYGTDNNAINKDGATSTRTGYYLRKLLREDCNPDPNSKNAKYHIPIRIRYTEIFLAYAEAANDAWGPTGKGSHSYSAYDVIKAIRQRAGIIDGDAYLESVKNDKDKMAELIRNERRIELCFENKRFWDMRRWKMSLDETAKGMEISKTGDVLSYKRIEVEKREYKDYMYYGPVPQSESLKWSALEQNKGWE